MTALRLTVNGVECALPLDVSLELARRLRALDGTHASPALAAAVSIETYCELARLPADLPLTDREEAQVALAVEIWHVEARQVLPAPVQRLREALAPQAA